MDIFQDDKEPVRNPCRCGLLPGAYSPAATVADNDLALGRLVDAVSHSRFWKEAVILVVEDDAQTVPIMSTLIEPSPWPFRSISRGTSWTTRNTHRSRSSGRWS
jgi:hypothetical protein